ncbi:4'-phosphopantetheinyl transferase family protein [Peterkaempfera bronchialis]|uniref:4'-phosphopantetheinyl transferase family protein n=1 Tax=Peterkaempfera bronchialis TaxID=2126346 RepID=UPI003C2DC11B
MQQDMTAGGALLPRVGHRPVAGAVEVRLLDAAGPGEARAAERLAAILAPEEQQRAASFVRAADRNLYLVAHVGLRLLLGACLGVPPAAVDLRRAPCPLCGALHGRPEVAAEPALHFSLSHSGTVALCAVAAEPVGVDVETSPAGASGAELAGALHPMERHALALLPEERRAEAFLHCWVRKEAYLKGIGTGLGIDPATMRVGLGPQYGDPAPPSLGGWTLAPVPAPVGSVAAVALLHGDAPAVTVRPLPLGAVVAAADRTAGESA